MVIFKGKVHLSTWYKDAAIPPDWVIAVSENGWTNNKLGLTWLRDVFDKHTSQRTVGKYRLLILDGHGSHATPEFDKFCSDRSIITLCMPAHSSHLLQPLDVGCFSTLKRSYRRLVREYIRLGVNYIDKTEFLPLFKQARAEALSQRNIQSGFAATGLVPLNLNEVLSRLQIRAHTPPPADTTRTENQALWQPETPHDLTQLDLQVAAIKDYFMAQQIPSLINRAMDQLIKGCQMAMHNTVLLSSENEKLRAANERQKQKKKEKRTQLATGGTLTVAQGRERIQEREVVQNPPAMPVEGVAPKTNRRGLPSCYICYSFDHIASACPKQQ